MATNLALDDSLIVEALEIGHHKTKREAVTEALQQYIAYKKQLEIMNIFGSVEFDPEYDYKKGRTR